MRGKGDTRKDDEAGAGITPAYAGKSQFQFQFQSDFQDHPRLCGEKGFGLFPQPLYLGSPPPMRGKASTNSLKSAASGITPAYAGKSLQRSAVHQNHQDHPRLCGEKRLQRLSESFHRGSPPPMRGKAPTAPSAAIPAGITPAYAGKSPRVGRVRAGRGGSPPPMRGKATSSSSCSMPVRITPAYAGKSRTAACSLPLPWDHPRLCGEKFDQMCFAGRDPGSPPPMRGKVQRLRVNVVNGRITPAYAGKSLFFRRSF